MRSEAEMMELILDVARKDDRIRAVYMNGSRTNKNADRDIFQDYDIVYVVRENRPFIEDVHWIDIFGERLYMQMPEQMDMDRGMDCDPDACYGWLIQFQDGNRLDLHVEPMEHLHILEDKLCVVLLDKDQVLPRIPEATDEDYRVKKPEESYYLAACNEFWWCLNNVAKGLWRKEIPYVQDMLQLAVRPQLVHLLNWKIGYENDFMVCTGKSGKYMHKWLPEEMWQRFLKTYAGGGVEEIWEAVFTMCDLFDEVAREVAEDLGFTYNQAEAAAGYGYLKHVRSLPEDARSVYPQVHAGRSGSQGDLQ